VELAGSMLSEGISSKLTNSVVYVGSCSISCGCCGALLWLQGILQAWLDTPRLGGAMGVQVDLYLASSLCISL
jgi:hypothetical protein